MDEQVLRLFADVGPHAKDALDSYILLQWMKFLVPTSIGILMLIGIIFVIIKAINAPEE